MPLLANVVLATALAVAVPAVPTLATAALPPASAALGRKAAAPPQPATTAPAAVNPAAPDYSGYQELLDAYLRVVSSPGAPLETRMDYYGLFTNPIRAQKFEDVRAQLLPVNPARLDVKHRHAWAINAYNMLVIQLVTENFVSGHVSAQMRAKGIFGVPWQSVRDIRVNAVPFFDVVVARIGTTDYSLNSFERTFVFDGYPAPGPGAKPAPPPRTLDPRAHFALVNGAIGSPPLQPRAFLPESLDAQLDQACRDALASPRHLQWDPVLHRVAASSLLSWSEGDFGGPSKTYEFVERFAPDSLHAALAAKPQHVIDTFVPWDWDLNWVRVAAPHAARMAPTRSMTAPADSQATHKP